MKSRTLRWVLALSLGALALGLALRNPEPFKKLLEIELWAVLAMFMLIGANTWLIGLRMRMAVNQVGDGKNVGLWKWFKIIAVGQFLNQIVPQLGNAYRAMTLKREHGVQVTVYITGLIAFLWIDTMLSATLALVLVLTLHPELEMMGAPAWAVVGFLLAGELVGPFVLHFILRHVPVKRPRLLWVKEKITVLLKTTGDALKTPSFVLKLAVVNVFVSTVQMTALWVSFSQVGVSLSLPTLAVYQVLVKLSNHVVITPGNLGIAELGWGFLSSATSKGVETGVAAAMLFRAASVLSTLFFGLTLGGFQFLKANRSMVDEDLTDGDGNGADTSTDGVLFDSDVSNHRRETP
ncbi:MAG: flippase-like domain-containing protein [Deltaproteobacteria bacterium]|nr:flippase-like domain-containing protein [Deltaproteobacteria bacterium]